MLFKSYLKALLSNPFQHAEMRRYFSRKYPLLWYYAVDRLLSKPNRSESVHCHQFWLKGTLFEQNQVYISNAVCPILLSHTHAHLR